MSRRLLVAFLALAAILAGLREWRLRDTSLAVVAEPVALRGSASLTVALTGDTVIGRPLPAPGEDEELDGVGRLLRDASLAVTNLDQAVLTGEPSDSTRPWPFASARDLAALRRIGIGVVSCANNHAIDYGEAGLEQTRRLIAAAGLVGVGCGDDLDDAARPGRVADASRSVVVVAIAASAAPQSRATRPRGDILGRPGVNALWHTAAVTADPQTFATLRSLLALPTGVVPEGDELRWQGAVIRQGADIAVEWLADDTSVREILRVVAEARTEADALIVSLHSHEPENRSEHPAPFVRAFARQAIEAGADLVVGHGPHRLRGVEVHQHGVILHSVGDFIFDYSAVDFTAADAYEAGLDLLQEALGAGGSAAQLPARALDEPMWWEGMIALAQFGDQRLDSVRLLPIDLGVDAPAGERGRPRLAHGRVRQAILDRLVRLSADMGTRIQVEDGAGVLDLAREQAGSGRED